MLLPVPTPYVSSTVSIFSTLVSAGEERARVKLSYSLRSFLIQCLIEHLRDTEITRQTLALGFLDAPTQSGAKGNNQLKCVEDGALILAGFFPERALALHVDSTYFRSMGEMAYSNLGARLCAGGKKDAGEFFELVASNFEPLRIVLNAGHVSPETNWGAYLKFKASIF